ncbi:hypothetical protein T265_04680 [Opisthorchis viverrini]|uniref:ENTH domain-containing protein n=1 Tax=Opisthorchis viverrini TaxID=6198 RepID=A0A074ZMD0_OPIVI|nr:hypothetical protein T265_04680 [Opisthorchis viverrini]KER28548.1 hypothetical protein T265_04680 [Opisthorchis viverrini]
MAGKVVKQLAGSGTGQSLSDIMTAMKHTLSGSLIAKIICKATTEEMISPKRKHLACKTLFQLYHQFPSRSGAVYL